MIYHNTEDNVTSRAYCSYIYDLEAGAGALAKSHGLHSRSAKALGPKRQGTMDGERQIDH
jgi:hypothetical protein